MKDDWAWANGGVPMSAFNRWMMVIGRFILVPSAALSALGVTVLKFHSGDEWLPWLLQFSAWALYFSDFFRWRSVLREGFKSARVSAVFDGPPP